MKFFNIDCHISILADIKHIFSTLGHDVDHWSLSGHKWIFNLPTCPSPVINEQNWKGINEQMVEEFYKAHGDELDKYDAFICGYPPVFLKLFEPFNKPIIVIAATRYDYPMRGEGLIWLDESIRNNKNLILIANNEYDQKYGELYTGVKWDWIPSLCEYTGAKYSGKLKHKILFSKFHSLEGTIHQSKLGTYNWGDLYSYEGIIHMPYNISTMSIFEQHTAGVPLYFPTLDQAIGIQGLFSEIQFPNSDRPRLATREWLELADFYNGTLSVNYLNGREIKGWLTRDYVYEEWKNILCEF